MRDFAVSGDPAVAAQLARLEALSLPQGRLGLEAVRALLSRLGDPHLRLPPVFHVAGTNGKGSTCAMLRAMLEAGGKRVHQFTSPHLCRYNERIRLSGRLISDADLAAVLEEVLDAGEHIGASFFEVTTAAAFLAFSRTRADACIVEVGLGGRFDATNVLPSPAACGIASLGLDHERFLLRPEDGTPANPMARIAFEKSGIAKSGVPLVTQNYAPEAEDVIAAATARTGALLRMRGKSWDAVIAERIEYRDRHGALNLPLPALAGAHQAQNAALAVALLRHQDRVTVSADAMVEGLRNARWPARLQWLQNGPLTMLAEGRRVLLDGGHNPDAAQAIARYLSEHELRPHAIVSMLAAKDARGFLEPLAPRLSALTAVPVPPGHEGHAPEALAQIARDTGIMAGTARSVEDALNSLPFGKQPVLIGGSLYMAGEVLRANGELPD